MALKAVVVAAAVAVAAGQATSIVAGPPPAPLLYSSYGIVQVTWTTSSSAATGWSITIKPFDHYEDFSLSIPAADVLKSPWLWVRTRVGFVLLYVCVCPVACGHAAVVGGGCADSYLVLGTACSLLPRVSGVDRTRGAQSRYQQQLNTTSCCYRRHSTHPRLSLASARVRGGVVCAPIGDAARGVAAGPLHHVADL